MNEFLKEVIDRANRQGDSHEETIAFFDYLSFVYPEIPRMAECLIEVRKIVEDAPITPNIAEELYAWQSKWDDEFSMEP